MLSVRADSSTERNGHPAPPQRPPPLGAVVDAEPNTSDHGSTPSSPSWGPDRAATLVDKQHNRADMLTREELTEPEQRVLDSIETGDVVDLLENGTAEERDPSNGADWGPDRTIRAAILATLFTDRELPDGRRSHVIRVHHAHIEGTLDLDDRELLCPLELTRCFCDQPIKLQEARARRLSLVGCQFPSLQATRLRTSGQIDLSESHTSQVVLAGARTEGPLVMSGTQLGKSPGGPVFVADNAQIYGGMFCRGGFKAEGEVRLLGAHIHGQLDLSEAQLSSPGGAALNLERASIGQLLLPRAAEPKGILNLTDARIVRLDDNWPATKYRAQINGLTYESLNPLTHDVKLRLEWLAAATDGYSTQPYEQLTGLLRQAGRSDVARRVAIAKETGRRSDLGIPGRAWNYILAIAVGYGYRAWLGVAWLTSVALAGWLIFGLANASHDIVALQRKGETAPPFHAWLYSLDSVLPVINLGQEDYWSPTGIALYWHTISVLAGWLLITLILGALTTRLVRD
jgi:hypothetical protein